MPSASSTAGLTKFSEAISSSVSLLTAPLVVDRATDLGILFGQIHVGHPFSEVFGLVAADLLEARDVAPALERGLQPDAQPARDGVVIADWCGRRAPARSSRCGAASAARSPRWSPPSARTPAHLVRGDALADAAAAEHDAAVHFTARHALGDREAEIRVIHRRLGRKRAEIERLVPE